MDSATSPALPPPTFPAHGEFAAVAAPDLLIELIRRRFSGTLRADRAGLVKVLYFNQGDFACASSNAEEDRLGNLLVRHGRLSADQLAHAKQRQGEKASIGNTLVELGFVSSAELLWGARRQVEEIVTDLLGWRDGTYQVRGAALSKEIVNLQLPARALVVRALQQLTDRELAVERLGSMEALLSQVEPFSEAARSFDFGFPVDDLLNAVDGRRSVREICEAVDTEDFQACKVLYTLLCFGLLRRSMPAPARELVFVEGELQDSQEIARVPEPSRWRRRRTQANGPGAAAPAPAPEPAPAAVEESREPSAATLEAEDEGVSIMVEEPTAPPEEEAAVIDSAPGASEAHRSRFRLPAPVWKGLIVLGLVALAGVAYYFTYHKPTLDPEEARLLSALMEEAESEGAATPTPPAPTAPPPSSPAEASPPAAATHPVPVLSVPAARPAASRPAAGPSVPLEKAPPLTMLSADPNFRSAMKLVAQRRIPEAADLFARALQEQAPDRYAIQLLLACQDSTLESSFERLPERVLYFVSTSYRGQTCYRLFDGIYPSEAEARADLERLPPLFREGGNRPAVVRLPRR